MWCCSEYLGQVCVCLCDPSVTGSSSSSSSSGSFRLGSESVAEWTVWEQRASLADLRAADPALLQQLTDGGAAASGLHAGSVGQKEDVQGGRVLC